MPKKNAKRPVPASILIRRGDNLRKRREALGWSQAQLAANAGTTQQTVDRIERGQTEFSRALPSIAEAMGLRLRINSREIYDEVFDDIKDQRADNSVNSENIRPVDGPALPTEDQLIPITVSTLESALRFAVSNKFPHASEDVTKALFSDTTSILTLSALAYFAEASGVIVETERRIIVAADELRQAITRSDIPWTWELEGHPFQLAREIAQSFMKEVDENSPADVWAKCGVALLALTMKYRLGTKEAARLLRGEADRLHSEDDHSGETHK